MKVYILLLLAGIVSVGCSAQLKGDKGDPGSPAPVPIATAITELVDAENDYRVALGQTPLTSGLTCTLYTVPNGSSGITGTTLTSVASFTMVKEFNQPDTSASTGLNILPVALQSLYTSWYVVRCTGKIVVTETGYYGFDLTSDDGSLLYVGGSLIVNNDGNHGATTKSGMKFLRAGVSDFRLDYMQGPSGNQALILSSGGDLISAEHFYH